jgi:nitroimidazol reductase NimA-like FMN-containing flavoprotein (pyridoxamine 5'-phosphate oxidase superfamily)
VAGDVRRVDPRFDVDAFLARPLVARVATSGPRVRPVWFLWEERCFWWLTGSWSSLDRDLARDPRVELVVDTCDLESGEVLQVRARGEAELVPYDPERATRKLSRYLGPEPALWEPRFRAGVVDDAVTRFVKLAPIRLVARDLSFAVASS